MADLDPPKEGTPLLVVGTQANPLQHVLGRNPWFKLATLVVALCAVVAVGAIYTRTRATSGTLDAGFAPSCREHDSMNPLPAKQSYPVHIIQYGHPRTATTLQYQMLCALTKAMHPTSRVKCTLLQETWKSSDPWGGLLPESANDKFDFLVIKTHSIKALNDQMRKLAGHPSVFIFHSVESDGDWKHESKDHSATQGLVDYIGCTSVDELKERGVPGLLDKYTRVFRIPNDVVNSVQEYMEPFDKLRLCCGDQMSKAHALTLLGREDELTAEERETEARTCGAYNLTKEEEKLRSSTVFRQYAESVPALRHVSAWKITDLALEPAENMAFAERSDIMVRVSFTHRYDAALTRCCDEIVRNIASPASR